MLLLIGCGYLLGMASASGGVTITPDNAFLRYDGIYNPTISSSQAVLSRFDDWVYDDPETLFSTFNAQTQSGAVLRFRTASPNLTVSFAFVGGRDRGLSFAVYQNGQWIVTKSSLVFTLQSAYPGQPVTYQITLPAFHNVAFQNIELDDGMTLLDPADDPSPQSQDGRPILTVFGDSISHGTGQSPLGTQKTYPWMLSLRHHYNLYNLAVGGARTSPSLGTMMQTHPMDVGLLFYGHNDWQVNDLSVFTSRYTTLLTRLRSAHPDAPLYCMTPSHTTKTDPPAGKSVPIEQFRQAIRDEVGNRQTGGDEAIFLLEGPWFINVQNADLFLSDTVHLNNDGATYLGQQLDDYVYQPGYSPDVLTPDALVDLVDEDGDGQGDSTVNAIPGTAQTAHIGERYASASDDKLHRVLLRFALPDRGDRLLIKALLRVSLHSSKSPAGNVSVLHSVTDNAGTIDASYYEKAFQDTGEDILQTTAAERQYHDVDVTSQVLADYANEPDGNAWAVFRCQADGATSQSSATRRYIIGTGNNGLNYPGPHLVLVFRDAFEFTSIMTDAIPENLGITWKSVFGELYSLQTSDDLGAWTPAETNITATPPFNTFTWTLDDSQRKFFRIKLE